MGYDPARYHTGRAPLEAAALGVALAPEEVAFRCNLVTLRHENQGIFMEDYAAGRIGGGGSPAASSRSWIRLSVGRDAASTPG